MISKKYSRSLDGKEFTVELNNWAEQASGSVLVRLGDTLVLATAVMSAHPREGGGDFFPLTVEYEEKFYATGKILGSRFIKRETRPSEEAVLAGRFIDRSVRPLFNHRIRNEVQVVVTVLSIDDQNDPDVLGLLAASLALGISNIPWNGPIAGVRIGIKDGAKILNPVTDERNDSRLDMIVSGTGERINMIEAGAGEVPEDSFAEAVEWGFGFIKELIDFQKEIIKENGLAKIEVPLIETPTELRNLLKEKFWEKIESAIYQKGKQTMHSSLALVKEEWVTTVNETYPDKFKRGSVDLLFEEAVNDIVHDRIIKKGERPDSRRPDELRELKAEVGILPRVHGSAIFMRGQTHALATLTLGAPGDEQIIEGMEVRTKKRFLLHYNFPPYSVGEVKPMRGPGRREIGHGALAGKAILPLLPPKEDFPYTMRVVSEILSSNGSSSMASVCGASLALMDAGVPIKKHAAGAAMGLMMNDRGEYKVLTDIQGPEDHHGDMDFKVAGTRDGINAVQMDVKIEGITITMLRDVLKQTLKARLEILDFMESVLDKSRTELSPWAPRITILKINPEKIGALIGPGGKIINGIIAETGVEIDINDDGTVFITSAKEEGMKKALALVKQVTRELKAGELLEGKVTRILDFGAMVEVGPRQDGLIHISELAPWRVERVTDILNIGDVVPVKIKNIDEQGRVNLSLKDVPGRYSPEDIKKHESQQREYPQERPPSFSGRGSPPRGGPPRRPKRF